MKIGILGGTGGMGEGFALRWSLKHDVIVGSRDIDRAKDAAQNYTKVAQNSYGNSMVGSISGDDNFSLANFCDVLILCIPYESIDDTCTRLADEVKKNDCIIVSPIVPMTKTDAGFVYTPFEQMKKPAAIIVDSYLGSRLRVISAFHTVSEVKLKNVKESIDSDTFVCGNDQKAIADLNGLISEINGLRSIYLGPLSMTYQAEILTPMLLNAARKNKLKNPGIRLV